MHRTSTTSVGFNSQSASINFINQTTAPIVLLTAADTDIQTLAAAISRLPKTFPALRVANILQLQQQVTIDHYAEAVLAHAKVIILRLIGGRSYWPYGVEVVQEIVTNHHTTLIVMPGDDALDFNLISHSNLPPEIVQQIWRYFNEGGIENFVNGLKFITDTCFHTSYQPPPPQVVPRVGRYLWENWEGEGRQENIDFSPCSYPPQKAAILFYRAHYLAGNTQAIDALCGALIHHNLIPVPVFISSLREGDVQGELIRILAEEGNTRPRIILNTTSFSLARIDSDSPQLDLWQQLDVPVFQVILSGAFRETWELGNQGLTPRDMAMNVALPEVDGRIITRAISFKALQTRHPDLETDVVVYEPIPDRIDFVAQLAANWVKLQQKPPQKRRLALILANYPSRDGRIANGVGLDTPQSCVEILQVLQKAGYSLDDIPSNGDELITLLTSTITNDPESKELRPILQSLSRQDYLTFFHSLPTPIQTAINQRWGTPDTEPSVIPISGIQLGNIFIGIQPPRGYDLDPSLNFHDPDLVPNHSYLAFYYWIREFFGADAVVQIGKHGNLEWLPGKSIALSQQCYPEIALGALPLLYPFIVNDPGEGSQAKRRSQAVIIDHLTPPLTRSELYGNLHDIENLIDEYYEATTLDPKRLPLIIERLRELINQENLHLDLNLKPIPSNPDQELPINQIDAYLCDLKEAQIRDGLHILGKCPSQEQLRDLIIAIARHPNPDQIGLTRAISQSWQLDLDPLGDNFATPLTPTQIQILATKSTQPCRLVGDAVAVLEEYACELVGECLKRIQEKEYRIQDTADNSPPSGHPDLRSSLKWIETKLIPALTQTDREITNLLHGLDGGYVPSGASGAPTRGRPEVLPTGNNFYSVDTRSLPTESAWDVGRKAAETLIECYTQEYGEYPKTLGISLWGTATMRTGGDDIAQALALLGVRPVWDGVARRVVDLEILPISVLGRPRVDVTLRISGFFRDAFGNLIDLFAQAVAAVAELEESEEENPLAANVKIDMQAEIQQGLSPSQARARSQSRIFGSKPGAYGSGLQGLIEAQAWEDDADLARAYINGSAYAYGSHGEPLYAPSLLKTRLSQMQIVLQNQDNREHDLLDSDDYYQFQGGLTAAVRSLKGENPTVYFGDNSQPSNPRIRHLRTEIARVYRSRVVNPKWIAGVMRHGYKGAFELTATVDYLFAYDATAQCVEDHMYTGVAQAYLFDPSVCEFIQQKNPWALRDIAERLLEAYQRNLWQDVSIQTIDKLRNLVHQAEASIENKQVV